MFKSPKLNTILKAELAAGNVIAEETTFPPKCEKLVILSYSFKGVYDEIELNYQVVNDPHYWYAEYMTSDGTEGLACRYV